MRLTRTRRRSFAAATLAVILVVLVGSVLWRERGRGAALDAADRPNFVVVMTDDQSLRGLDGMRQTQRLVADRGVSFENFFVSYPLCSPSRATFLTGQYSHNHGVRGNHPPDGGFGAFDPRATMPLALNRSGYRTGLVGKVMNGYPNRAEKDPSLMLPGFSYWFASIDSLMFGWRANENGEIVHFGNRPADYLTDVEAQRGAAFIEDSAEDGKPFFLAMETLAPHKEAGSKETPNPRPAPRDRGRPVRDVADPSPSVDERDVSDKPAEVRELPRLGPKGRAEVERRNRWRRRSLEAVDDMVGQLVRTLRREGELDQTYFVFTSDNGFALGEHRAIGKGLLYDESLRVPMLIRGPGIPAGQERRQLTSNVDLAPTFLEAAGVSPLAEVDGRSLLPLIEDRDAGRGRDLLVENGTASGIRSRDAFYAENRVPGEGVEYELYDLTGDPYQLDNRLGPGGPGDLSRGEMAERLDQLRDCAGKECG